MIRSGVMWGRQVLARRGRWLLSIGLVIAVFVLLGWSVVREWDTVKRYPWRLDGVDLLLASLFHSLGLGITFVVWHLMIRRLGRYHDVRANAHIYYLSTLAKRVPSAIWYVGGRLLMYQQVGVLRSAVLNATVLETVLIGSAGAVVYLVLQPFYAYAAVEGGWIIAVAGLGALGLFFVRPRLLLDGTNWLLRRWKRAPMQAQVDRRDLMLWAALYMLPWPLAGGSLYFLIRAVTVEAAPDVVSIIGVSTLSMLVGLLSIVLPGGFGLKELTAAALLSTWMPLSAGVVVAIAYRLLTTLDEVLWAAVAWAVQRRRPGDKGQ